jgi:hypothetical protein
MTIYTVRVQGLLMGRRFVRSTLALSLLATLGGCEIEWGGATVHLEDPSPPPVESPAAEPSAERAEVPLPEGPLLWAVRSDGPGGEVLAMPVARLVDGVPTALEYPEPPPDGFRERFDAAFAAEGTELFLGASGIRLGSLVLSGSSRVLDAGCPSAVPARALVLPGTSLPSVSFALGPDLVFGSPGVPQSVLVDNRVRTFGPILTEQLLRQGGEDRPFLAQRAVLEAVPWPGDERPAMAATYLINDSVEGPGPTGSATSLFFLARFGASGYVADWTEMRTYSGPAGSREIFTWLGATPVPGGRLDLAVRHDGATRRIVASVDSDDPNRGVSWTEGARCPALELLEAPGSQGASNTGEVPVAEGTPAN